MEYWDDDEVAFNLQIKEAITASLESLSYSSPSPSSPPPPPTLPPPSQPFRVEDNYYIYDRDSEIPTPSKNILDDGYDFWNDLINNYNNTDNDVVSNESSIIEYNTEEVPPYHTEYFPTSPGIINNNGTIDYKLLFKDLMGALMPEAEDHMENEMIGYGHVHDNRGASDVAFSSSSTRDQGFRLYFKGLIGEEKVGDKKMIMGAIGAAVFDQDDELVVKVRKPLQPFDESTDPDDDRPRWSKSRCHCSRSISGEVADLMALIKGLDAALSLDLKIVTFFCDDYMVYQYVTGRLVPRDNKITTLINEVYLLQSKFTSCKPSLVARNDMKLAFKFARDAIIDQINSLGSEPESSKITSRQETCEICCEEADVDDMFTIDDCSHRYCISCIKQHVEMKLLSGYMSVTCPQEGCHIEVKIERCTKFLEPKLIEVINQRMRETSVPPTERVYCPNPRCSALMLKSEAKYNKGLKIEGKLQSGARKCMKCKEVFCIKCKVAWHYGKSCKDYNKLISCNEESEDAKLKSLATENLWQQCGRCKHLVELTEGCFHITCRCGYEFCYKCGAKWKNKKPTCSCPIWNEQNIIHDE